jgi:hypothetical protein
MRFAIASPRHSRGDEIDKKILLGRPSEPKLLALPSSKLGKEA